jgi:MFS family permease
MSALAPLANRTFARLYAAQIVALLGTGLLTIALALLAYDIAGAQGGLVLGMALTLKMVAYVALAPVANAVLGHLPRRGLLVTLDLLRAAVALCLPFVTEVWQIYTLIFVLQAASAAFTPTFHAAIPDILPDEGAYTRALSLSRLAYDVENIASPALAALLLTLVPANDLFLGTAAGFLASALLVGWANPPRAAKPAPGNVWHRTAHGTRVYLATPRLRGLLALNMAAAAGGAMVIVNTAVIVRAGYGFDARAVAWATGAFGAGSIAAALALPRLLDRRPDRPLMLTASVVLTALLTVGGVVFMSGQPPWPLFLVWLALTGLAYTAILTPGGRLLRRSAGAADRPALFAAQFALSHACWLLAYPAAGQLGARIGMGGTALVLATVSLVATLMAVRLWPKADTVAVAHSHPDLPPDHPHLAQHRGPAGDHRHEPVTDALHPLWPHRP